MEDDRTSVRLGWQKGSACLSRHHLRRLLARQISRRTIPSACWSMTGWPSLQPLLLTLSWGDQPVRWEGVGCGGCESASTPEGPRTSWAFRRTECMTPRSGRSGLTPFGRKALGCHTRAFCSRGCTSSFTTLMPMVDDGKNPPSPLATPLTVTLLLLSSPETECCSEHRGPVDSVALASLGSLCWSVVGRCVQQRQTLGPNWPSDARRRRKDRGCRKICPGDLRSSANAVKEIGLIGLEVNQPPKDLQEIEEFGREVRTPVARDHVIQL